MTGSLQALLDQGVRDGVYPAAQAVVLHRGKELFSGAAGDATPDTVFDLASLTKILCTTPLFMAFWGEGKAGPETPVERIFPHSRAAAATVRLGDLLYHRSGLPAWQPFFAEILRALPALLRPDASAELRAFAREDAVKRVLAVSLEKPYRAQAIYSDVGFILLGEALAQVGGAPLDVLFDQRIAKPLGLSMHFRRLSAARVDEPLAPTGTHRPRPPAPGQDALWGDLEAVVSPPGEVDDDNAWIMDGVAGHAGLFGTARDVAQFGQRLLEELDGAGRIAPAPLWMRAVRRDTSTPGSTRALGFDTPSEEGSMAGSLLGKQPPGAVGHSGFTGTTLFVDLARRLVVALNTNRTYLGRSALKIREFRPKFHDAAVAVAGG